MLVTTVRLTPNWKYVVTNKLFDDCTICQVEQDSTFRHRRAAEEHLTLQP
jgi:hypothetical protein